MNKISLCSKQVKKMWCSWICCGTLEIECNLAPFIKILNMQPPRLCNPICSILFHIYIYKDVQCILFVIHGKVSLIYFVGGENCRKCVWSHSLNPKGVLWSQHTVHTHSKAGVKEREKHFFTLTCKIFVMNVYYFCSLTYLEGNKLVNTIKWKHTN